jgi:hypothetical protein
MSEGADQVYEVYEPPCLSCCVGTEAIGSCMSGEDREPQQVMGLAARNKERGAEDSNTSALRIGEFDTGLGLRCGAALV